MRSGNAIVDIPPYEDHAGLWANGLNRWVPDTIFDAHAHLGPPDAMGTYPPERLREPLCTFGSLTWEELGALHARLFPGKRVAGVVAFPFPHREVDWTRPTTT